MWDISYEYELFSYSLAEEPIIGINIYT